MYLQNYKLYIYKTRKYVFTKLQIIYLQNYKLCINKHTTYNALVTKFLT